MKLANQKHHNEIGQPKASLAMYTQNQLYLCHQ
jgi:hypothetical protein